MTERMKITLEVEFTSSEKAELTQYADSYGLSLNEWIKEAFERGLQARILSEQFHRDREINQPRNVARKRLGSVKHLRAEDA